MTEVSDPTGPVASPGEADRRLVYGTKRSFMSIIFDCKFLGKRAVTGDYTREESDHRKHGADKGGGIFVRGKIIVE